MAARPIHVVHVLEATGGGTGRHVLDVMAGLDAERFRQTAIVSSGREPSFPNDVAAVAKTTGHRVITVPMRRSISPLADMRAARRLAAVVGGMDADVVHAHSAKAGGLVRLGLGRNMAGQILYTPHCWPFAMRVGTLRQWLYAAIERGLARRCARIVCVCEWERSLALERRVASPERLVVIPNGVETLGTPAGPPSDRPAPLSRLLEDLAALKAGGRRLVAIVGRFEPQKGQLELLRALTAAPPSVAFSRCQFVFLGDGPLRAKAEALAARNGWLDRCRFPGHIPQARLALPKVDLAVIPSLWEGLPYTVLDAMAAAIPVVACAVGGIPEVIGPDDDGWLTPPGDEVAMVRAIEAALGNDDRRIEVGRRAQRKIASRYRLEQMLSSLATLYQVTSQARRDILPAES